MPEDKGYSGFIPDATYVTRYLESMRFKTRGLKERIKQIEQVRYLEDPIQLSAEEVKTGIEVRIGATAEMGETIKASIIANIPMVHVEPGSDREGSQDNASKREHFWNRVLERLQSGTPELDRFVDAVSNLGVGFLKGYQDEWPGEERIKRSDESYDEHLERVTALKRVWGPPVGAINIHPSAMYPRFGRGNKLTENCEHSYKPRVDVWRNYGISDKRDFYTKRLGKDILDKEVAQLLVAQTGVPTPEERPQPYGWSGTTECLVTEYWMKDCHQVYIDRSLIYQELGSPGVTYIMALGRTNSSNEYDKLGFGVAELMSVNERAVNRGLTRMMEAMEVIVHPRNALELPAESTFYLESDEQEGENQGEARPFEIRFEADKAKAVPPGGKIVDTFPNAAQVFQGLQAIQVIMGVMNSHGANPLFKGVPTAANGSGYNNNSMLNSAKAQYQYIVNNIQMAYSELVRWWESRLVHTGEKWYIDELELEPSDVTKWPAKVTVSITPNLPQDMMAKGTFWDRMFASRHVPRRVVREQGLDIEDPEAMEWEVMREDLRESLKPQLYLDVIAATQGPPPAPPQSMQPNESQELDPGQMGIRDRGGTTRFQQNGAGRDSGRTMAGLESGGQAQQPRILPGDTTPRNPGGAL